MLPGQGSLLLYPQAACPVSPPAFSAGSPVEALWSAGPRVTIWLCVASSSVFIDYQGLYPQEDSECNTQGRHRPDGPKQYARASYRCLLIDPSPTQRKEKKLKANRLLQAWQLLHFLAGAAVRTAALSLSTPLLQFLSFTDHLHWASNLGRLMAAPRHLGTTAQRCFPAPFSWCLLPICLFSGPPLSKGNEKKERI